MTENSTIAFDILLFITAPCAVAVICLLIWKWIDSNSDK